MDDKKLAGFATKSESAIDQMRKEEARLIIHEFIAESGCTDFEVADDDLREKGVKSDIISDITSVTIPGVKLTWATESTLSIMVDTLRRKTKRIL